MVGTASPGGGSSSRPANALLLPGSCIQYYKGEELIGHVGFTEGFWEGERVVEVEEKEVVEEEMVVEAVHDDIAVEEAAGLEMGEELTVEVVVDQAEIIEIRVEKEKVKAAAAVAVVGGERALHESICVCMNVVVKRVLIKIKCLWRWRCLREVEVEIEMSQGVKIKILVGIW